VCLLHFVQEQGITPGTLLSGGRVACVPEKCASLRNLLGSAALIDLTDPLGAGSPARLSVLTSFVQAGSPYSSVAALCQLAFLHELPPTLRPTRADDVASMINAYIAAFGRIDVLHNNVGIVELGGPVETTEASWDWVNDVNLKSMFLTCKQALPHVQRCQR
jgi:NAD(P)-dependent dehydrogenase (short-subunit alcohol dehydrogenase family)